jgi:hypothetical protein
VFLWEIDYCEEYNENFRENYRTDEEEKGENWDGQDETDLVFREDA